MKDFTTEMTQWHKCFLLWPRKAIIDGRETVLWLETAWRRCVNVQLIWDDYICRDVIYYEEEFRKTGQGDNP